MILYFGLDLDESVYPRAIHNGDKVSGGIYYAGIQGLLQILETYLGLAGHPTNNEYLQIEEFRQALIKHLEQSPGAFYQTSFEADQFATAGALLERRNELLLAGWNFEGQSGDPHRLLTLAEIEAILSGQKEQKYSALDGSFANRFVAIREKSKTLDLPFTEIHLVEPIEILPFYIYDYFKFLEQKGIILKQIFYPEIPESSSDLDILKKRLLKKGKTKKINLKGDGSLLLFKTKRETDAAVFLAQLLRHNPEFRPLCLIPEKNRSLDNAFIQEGLPSLGILSASLARPLLQILKLVPSFLWEPVNPFQIMEFVTLSIKPLRDDLAQLIARMIAQTPGLKSDNWMAQIARYFEELRETAAIDPTLDFNEVQFQYQFWFERQRYNLTEKVPKENVIEIFKYINQWAFKIFDTEGKKQSSLLVLSEQAKRIVELLETLPENQLSHLELERVVRTIYEPAPVLFKKMEKGHLPFVHKAGSLIAPVENLLWWNFIRNERDHFFSRWYKDEIKWLQNKHIRLESPERENARLLWQRPQPVLNCKNRLLLVLPERVDGKDASPHALFADLEAAFENLAPITIDIDNFENSDILKKYFKTPGTENIPVRQLGIPKAYLQIERPERFEKNERESFSSLDALFYYPYQWIFKHKIKLNKSSILSVVKDTTLMGNLAHRMFEKMFKEEVLTWNQQDTQDWVRRQSASLLAQEGVVFLMYGREPERQAFVNRLQFAAWSLLHMIQSNGWKIRGTELPLNGKFLDLPITGKADLVLEKGNGELSVVDLKWSGTNYRKNTIKNEEDLQLVLYSKLLTADTSWAHTSYFIIKEGKMLARNNLAFREAEAIRPGCDHIEINERIWQKMKSTFQWRMKQIAEGKVEVRTKKTLIELEDNMNDAGITLQDLQNLLTMKTDDASFDDFKTLINLIQ